VDFGVSPISYTAGREQCKQSLGEMRSLPLATTMDGIQRSHQNKWAEGVVGTDGEG
jgi:hypothetical protein